MELHINELNEFEYKEFLNLMWIQVTSIGQENIYFNYQDSKGHIYKGYCKCL
jgi:hypothetical protein